MFCRNCGKEIDDSADVCIYCGADTERRGADTEQTVPAAVLKDLPEKPKKINAFGLTGFIVSLVSLFFTSLVISIVGIVFSSIGIAKRNRAG